MPSDHPRTGPRHEPERIYERAADPAEAADRPLEPRAPNEPAAADARPAPTPNEPGEESDPHHALNTPVGEPAPDADSDPYRPVDEENESDRASGVRGSGQGAERR